MPIRMVLIDFNPRSREGCDIKELRAKIKAVKFQSTQPRGLRQNLEEYQRDADIFQSTQPRGLRPMSRYWPDRIASYFNPRSREGCDLSQVLRGMAAHISIHAAARAATG